jgi:hypothetical protein
VVVLRLGSRSDAISSCVAVFDGQILTGEAAQPIAGFRPAAYEPTPKRRLSEDEVVLGGAVYDPVDLVAAVFRFVIVQATRYVGGGTPATVLLTHPEAWDEYMKQRLTDAAVKAGVREEDLKLMPEPVAAAWHYAVESTLSPGAHIGVLDFGGGTCDAAVLKLAGTASVPLFEVVSSGGIDPLGGHDFDAQLERWVHSQLDAEGKWELLQHLTAAGAASDRAILRDQVREAKHALSFHGSAPIGVRAGGQEWVCTVTRDEFDHLIDRQLLRAVALVRDVIQKALPSTEQLYRVYLTGGSSHIPALQSKLSESLPLKLGMLGDPKQITSIGALQAPTNAPKPAASKPAAPKLAVPNPAAPKLAAPKPAVPKSPAPKPAVRKSPALPPPKPPDGHHGKRGLVLAAVAAAIALIGFFVVASNQGKSTYTPLSTGPYSYSSYSPAPSRPPTRSPVNTTPASAACAALSPDECALVGAAKAGSITDGMIDPASCSANSGKAPSWQAVAGIACDPRSSGGLRPRKVFLFKYGSSTSMDSEFKAFIDDYSAGKGDVTDPPAWNTWSFTSDSEGTVRGSMLSFPADGTMWFMWTEDSTLQMGQIRGGDLDAVQLHQWWADVVGN